MDYAHRNNYEHALGKIMTLTVYNVSGAPRPWRVLVGLTLKGLDYEMHYLESSSVNTKLLNF